MALEFNKDSSDLLEMVEIKKKLKKGCYSKIILLKSLKKRTFKRLFRSGIFNLKFK